MQQGSRGLLSVTSLGELSYRLRDSNPGNQRPYKIMAELPRRGPLAEWAPKMHRGPPLRRPFTTSANENINTPWAKTGSASPKKGSPKKKSGRPNSGL
jgi:hypothetical protein